MSGCLKEQEGTAEKKALGRPHGPGGSYKGVTVPVCPMGATSFERRDTVNFAGPSDRCLLHPRS